MNKIESLILYRLHNNEHYQFMTDVDTIIGKLTDTELSFDNLYPGFKIALMTEENAIHIDFGCRKSNILEELDTLRDNTWSAIDTKIKAVLLSPFYDEFKSAVILKEIIDRYGDPRSLSYKEESIALINLVNDLLKPNNSACVEKIELKAWISELKNQNEKFLSTFDEWNAEYASRENMDVRSTRKLIDPLYIQITEKINASIVLGMSKPAIETCISELNDKINYYKRPFSIRICRNKVVAVAAEKA